jgi:predicted negative regulator of RcsB-dependent stress response
MATASRRITRKQLRQPDWLHTTTEQALEFYEGNRVVVLTGAVVLILLLLGVWALQAFKQSQDNQAAQEFSRAMNLYQTEKYREAVPAFQKAGAYRWSHYAVLAHLYEANSYLAINDLDKAITAAERFIAGTSSDSLYRQMGLLTLASAEEQKNQCKQAVEHYSQAAMIKAAFRGRCAEHIGDTKGALAAYKEYLQDNPDSPLAIRVAELEAKTGRQAVAK